MDKLIIDGHISHIQAFPDGNNSYTVRDERDGGALYRFTEATPLGDKAGKPLLRGSLIQAEVLPIVDKKTGEPVVNTFEFRTPRVDENGKEQTEGQVSLCRLNRWYLVEAAMSADDKKVAQPLIAS